jgi:hypothetical protein
VATSASHPRPSNSHIAADSAAAARAVATTRIGPVPASGIDRATYHADRQMKE